MRQNRIKQNTKNIKQQEHVNKSPLQVPLRCLAPCLILQSTSFFKDPNKYDKVGLSKCWKDDSTNIVIESLLAQLNTISDWRKEKIDSALKSFADQNKLGMGKITMPIRMAISGSLSGPSVIEILALIGKEVTIHRLKKALEKLPI